MSGRASFASTETGASSVSRRRDAASRAELGLRLEIGAQLAPEAARTLAADMAERLFEAMCGGAPTAGGAGLLRLAPLATREPIDRITFSGGVAEYIYGREAATFGDLGPLLAQEIQRPAPRLGPEARALATKASALPSLARRNTPCR